MSKGKKLRNKKKQSLDLRISLLVLLQQFYLSCGFIFSSDLMIVGNRVDQTVKIFIIYLTISICLFNDSSRPADSMGKHACKRLPDGGGHTNR